MAVDTETQSRIRIQVERDWPVACVDAVNRSWCDPAATGAAAVSSKEAVKIPETKILGGECGNHLL